MELHLHWPHGAVRTPDWIAAAVAGLVAGAVLMVVELLWSLTRSDMTPWTIPHQIAAIVLGQSALQSDAFSVPIVALALVIHYLLGILFGVILGAVLATLHTDIHLRTALITGIVLGIVLYWFNFYVAVRWFPWFADERGGSAFLLHLLLGIVAASSYWQFMRVRAYTSQPRMT